MKYGTSVLNVADGSTVACAATIAPIVEPT